MKKLLWISFSIVLFLSGISSIKAETVLEPISNKNGNVEISLDFEEGYVGAIELALNVSSNVKVTNVNWNTSLPTTITKRYTYDETNHIVKIYLATGNNTKNLVDKNGKLKVGSLDVKSVNGESANYTVDIASLSIVDANYTSITKTDLKIGGNNQFTYQVNNDSVEEKPTDKPNQSKPNQNPSKDDFEKEPTEEKNPDEESGDKTESNEAEEGKTDDDNKTDVNAKPNNSKQPEELEESKAEKSFDWKIMFGIVVIAMLLITLISMLTRKFKD